MIELMALASLNLLIKVPQEIFGGTHPLNDFKYAYHLDDKGHILQGKPRPKVWPPLTHCCYICP